MRAPPRPSAGAHKPELASSPPPRARADAFTLLTALADRYQAEYDGLAPDAHARATTVLRVRTAASPLRAAGSLALSEQSVAALHSSGRLTPLLRRAQESVLRFNSRSRVDAVRAKVDAVRASMSDNIDKALERGERLDEVAAKSEAMRDQAAAFRAKGRALRRALWWQNARWAAALAVVTLIAAFAVFLAACRGFRCVGH